MPPQTGVVASFLHELIGKGAGSRTIKGHVAAIRYMTELYEAPDPTTDPLIEAIVTAAQAGKEHDEEGN
jgi:hypothetical protein